LFVTVKARPTPEYGTPKVKLGIVFRFGSTPENVVDDVAVKT
jgi:hypothetical protein